MTAILAALIPLAMKIIEALLDKYNADVETRKSWLDFVNLLGQKKMISVSLHQSYLDQGAALDAEIAKLEKEKQGG